MKAENFHVKTVLTNQITFGERWKIAIAIQVSKTNSFEEFLSENKKTKNLNFFARQKKLNFFWSVKTEMQQHQHQQQQLKAILEMWNSVINAHDTSYELQYWRNIIYLSK